MSAPALPAPPAHVAYTVTVADTQERRLHVSLRAEGLTEGTQTLTFQLPAWTPGWYVLRGNERNLSHFAVQGPNQSPLTVQQLDARTWQVAVKGSKAVTFSYDVKASDTGFGFFEPYLDQKHGFVPGPATLAYVVEGKETPCSVRYTVPEGWEVASANTPVPGQPHQFTAPNYDTLIDQPAELGTFTRYQQTIEGVPVSVVMVGGEPARYRRWADGVFKIAQAGIKLLGGPPFERYSFFFHFANEGGFSGGLEHLNCTVLRIDPSNLDRPDGDNFAIVAHEFIHAWNVKRIRPAALGPFDYTRPVRVKDLWFAEGVTDYFAPRVVVEAGLATQRFWLGYQAEQLTQLMCNPARHQVTLEETSLKVWESENESEGYGGLSYYNKGLVVGLLLDTELRRRTENRVGLEDVLKALLAQCQKTGRGYSDGEIERTAARLAGADLSAFFNRALRSTEELPIKETLEAGGIFVDESVTETATLGLTWEAAAAGQIRLKSVVPQGPAAQAGLRAGDLLLGLDDLQGGLLAQRVPGDSLTLRYQRGGEQYTVNVVLGKEESRSYRLRPLPRPKPQQAALLARISGLRP
ncbi:M61 family metallopeptidase [Armatimonas rosea]|uniref:Putative metalloprotease with PDZ domain n=1 Tax=Armatimonas rosea TaxID=685828 RepID=A0A7W9W775_ARMRO|nr:PDZ domain-containing protein [Armatimonas rosea]MBB6050941.1 putative metalloprotease with PDZ domain [Armatimonas rosea]